MQNLAENTNESKQTQAPDLDTPLADDIGEELEGVKLQLGYLARNMAGAFDGALSPIEANAHCALVTALGHLTTLEELQGHVRRKERAASGTHAAAPTADASHLRDVPGVPGVRPNGDRDPFAWTQDVRDELHAMLEIIAEHKDSLDEGVRGALVHHVFRALPCLTKAEELVREQDRAGETHTANGGAS